DSLRGTKIYHPPEFGRDLHWQLTDFGTAEDAIDKTRPTAKQLRIIRPIANQSPRLGKVTYHYRQPVLRRQCQDGFLVGRERCGWHDQPGIGMCSELIDAMDEVHT